MPVNPSIKKAPDEVVERLRAGAVRHRRSLQGELAIVEEAVGLSPRLTPDEMLAEVRCLGLATPAEAAAIVRADRDRR